MERLTIYDILNIFENDLNFLLLLKKGVIPLSVLDKKVYYEYYLNQRKTTNKAQSITNTSEEYKVSERTIIRAIDFMDC